MKIEEISAQINRIPFSILLIGAIAYFGYDYYTFDYDPGSPKNLKIAENRALKENNLKLGIKIKENTEFLQTLEQKKQYLRGLARELQEAKVTFSDTSDTPGFMKMVAIEAKKLNLSVLGLKPKPLVPGQYYAEMPFEMKFQGVFVQLVAFLNRLSNLNRIIQPDSIRIKVVGGNTTRFVLLDGEIELKIFKYVGSKEDEIGK